MAAVAGSKGRIELSHTLPESRQITAVRGILNGTFDAATAAAFLISGAKLREVGVDTNMICNLKCRYCYLEDRIAENGSVPISALVDKLLGAVDSGVKLVAFIGKEPLADDRATALCEKLDSYRACDRQFRTGMVTNGTLLDRWLDRICQANLSYLDMSIDGLSDEDNRLRSSKKLSGRLVSNVRLVANSSIAKKFATATVLTKPSVVGFEAFCSSMFDLGVVTCFASPVLRFAVSNDVQRYALSLSDIWGLYCHLTSRFSSDDRQIIVDLPYRYSWELLKMGYISVDDLQEDRYEALFFRPSNSSAVLKINPFPYSFWRALRVTHDGSLITNMDLAAHKNYAEHALPLSALDENLFSIIKDQGHSVLSSFIETHIGKSGTPIFERALGPLYQRQTEIAA